MFVKLPRVVAHASRGRENSYLGLFLSKSCPWPWLSPRGCLVISRTQNNVFFENLKGTGRPVGRPDSHPVGCNRILP